MITLIAFVVGDFIGFVFAWWLAHGLGARKGYAAGRNAASTGIPTQRRGDR